MRKILENKYLSLALRLFVGFVFIYAGMGKIFEPAVFAKEIYNYHILPDFLINVSALVLPWLEVVIGVFLIAGIRIKANAALSGILMAVFMIAILSAMFRGLNINCGCFSDEITLVGWGKILEDTGYLLGSVYLYFFPFSKFSVENLKD